MYLFGGPERKGNLKYEGAYKIKKSANNVTTLVALWKAKLEKTIRET